MNKEKAPINQIIFLEPHFEQKIWGSNFFKKHYKNNDLDNVGEAWIISAISNKSSKIINANKQYLHLFLKKNPNLLNLKKGVEFPLLVKIIAPKQNLSVQVHPNNAYSKKYENSLGKTEAWYILDFLNNKQKNEIILGLQTIILDDIKNFINQNKWDMLLKKQYVKIGDSVNIDSGIVHALTKDIVVLEVQQASDVTYRLFDYNRLDNGKLRDLHIDKSLSIITNQNLHVKINDVLKHQQNYIHNNDFFQTIKHKNFNIKRIIFNKNEDYKLFYVASGMGVIVLFKNGINIKISKNDAFIILNKKNQDSDRFFEFISKESLIIFEIIVKAN